MDGSELMGQNTFAGAPRVIHPTSGRDSLF